MIIIYLLFAALIAYTIRLYVKRNKPLKPIESKDFKKDIYENKYEFTWDRPVGHPLHPLNWDDD